MKWKSFFAGAFIDSHSATIIYIMLGFGMILPHRVPHHFTPSSLCGSDFSADRASSILVKAMCKSTGRAPVDRSLEGSVEGRGS